jgi:hypothetical protein
MSTQETTTEPAAPKKKAKVTKKSAKTTKPAKAKKVAKAPKPKSTRSVSKADKVLELMKRKEGATLAEIAKATDWQSHSIRGFVSGHVIKKLGLKVESTKSENGERTYRKSSPKRSLASSRSRSKNGAAFVVAQLSGHVEVGANLRKAGLYNRDPGRRSCPACRHVLRRRLKEKAAKVGSLVGAVILIALARQLK